MALLVSPKTSVCHARASTNIACEVATLRDRLLFLPFFVGVFSNAGLQNDLKIFCNKVFTEIYLSDA